MPPIRPLSQLSEAINTQGRVIGFLESIISIGADTCEYNGLTFSERRELKALLDQGGDARDTLWNMMTSCQKEIESDEQALRAPPQPGVQRQHL